MSKWMDASKLENIQNGSLQKNLLNEADCQSAIAADHFYRAYWFYFICYLFENIEKYSYCGQFSIFFCFIYYAFVIQVPTSQPTRLFSFMNPLGTEIWLYVLAAFFLVSFTLFGRSYLRYMVIIWFLFSNCLVTLQSYGPL